MRTEKVETDRQQRLAHVFFAQVMPAERRRNESLRIEPADQLAKPLQLRRRHIAIVAHVASAEVAYGRRIGLRLSEPGPGDAAATRANRESILAVLRRASDGGPVAGGSWPARYAARRIAWHALDHAWEIEDRGVPAD